LKHVNQELQKDMKNYSGAEYGKLLNDIKAQNGADVKANSHLPNLELYDNNNSGTPDSIKAKYSDGTTMTAAGQNQDAGLGHGQSVSDNISMSMGNATGTKNIEAAGAHGDPLGGAGGGSKGNDGPLLPPDHSSSGAGKGSGGGGPNP
jgi:hypothetical protein